MGEKRTHLVPVLRNLGQARRLADVDEVEHVLLEARPAEPYRGVEELVPDAGVVSESSRNLKNQAEVGDSFVPCTHHAWYTICAWFVTTG